MSDSTSSAKGPSWGRHSALTGPGLRKLTVGAHLVLYRFDDALLIVVRILDQRMDIAARLDETEH